MDSNEEAKFVYAPYVRNVVKHNFLPFKKNKLIFASDEVKAVNKPNWKFRLHSREWLRIFGISQFQFNDRVRAVHGARWMNRRLTHQCAQRRQMRVYSHPKNALMANVQSHATDYVRMVAAMFACFARASPQPFTTYNWNFHEYWNAQHSIFHFKCIRIRTRAFTFYSFALRGTFCVLQ